MSLVTRLRRSAAVENSPADPADHPTDELQPVETTDEAQPTTEGGPADDSAADSAADSEP